MPTELLSDEDVGLATEPTEPKLLSDADVGLVSEKSAALRAEQEKVRGQDRFARWFGEDLPILPPQAIVATSPALARFLQIQAPPGTAGKVLRVGQAAAATGTEALAGMTAPSMLPVAPVALVPGGAEAMGIYFGGEALEAGVRQISGATTPEEVGQGLGQVAMGVPMVGAGLRGRPLARFQRPVPPVLEVPVQPAAPAAQPEVIPDASRIPPSAEVHGPLPPQPVEGPGQVPAEKGGPGIQPPEETRGEVPLTVEEAKPLPPAKGEAPAEPAPAAPAVSSAETGAVAAAPVAPAKPTVSPPTTERQAVAAPVAPAKPAVTPPAAAAPEAGAAPGPSPMIPMGAATPGEFVPPRVPGPTGQAPLVPSITAIKNAAIDADRKVMGLPPVASVIPRGWESFWEEAMAHIDRDPNWQDRLIAEVTGRPRALNAEEHLALVQRRVDLKNEYNKAAMRANQAYADGRLQAVGDANAQIEAWRTKLDALDEATRAGGGTGTEAGRALAVRKVLMNEDFTLASLELQKRADLGGRPLTDAERAKLAQIASDYQRRVAELEKRIAELEADRPGLVPTVAKIISEGSKEPKRSAGEVTVDIQKVIDAIRKKVAKGDFDINIQAQRLAKYFVERGIREREPLIDAVHDVLKDLLPDQTRSDTMNAISGYGKFKPLTRDAVSVILRDLKGQMQQIGKLEDMAAKIAPKKTGVERRVPSDEERRLIKLVEEAKRRGGYKVTDPLTQLRTALQAVKTRLTNQIADLKLQIQTRQKIVREPSRLEYDAEANQLVARRNELKKQFDEIFGSPELTEAQRLERWKKRTTTRIAELREKLRVGDFAARQRPAPIVMDEAANQLKADLHKIEVEWRRARFEDKKSRWAWYQKTWHTYRNLVGIMRAWMTSFDLSALLRQAKPMVVSHPVRTLRQTPQMLRAFLSEEKRVAIDSSIRARSNYPLYLQSKLYLSEHGVPLSRLEESFMTSWIEAPPGGKAGRIAMAPVRASERAYTTMLNLVRADTFDALAARLPRDRVPTPEEARAIANFVNAFSGRGTIPFMEKSAGGLNALLFSPRYLASRFQMLMGEPLWKGPRTSRRLIAEEYARTLGGMAIYYTLLLAGVTAFVKAFGRTDQISVESDPRSSDFGKIRIGETRLDPWAGLQQLTVLAARLGTGKTKTLRGQVKPIRGPNVPWGSTTTMDVLANFGRQKLAPAPAAVTDVITGEHSGHEPVTPESMLFQYGVPISMQDIFASMREQGIPVASAMYVLSIFGEGIQHYGTETGRPGTTQQAYRKALYRSGAQP